MQRYKLFQNCAMDCAIFCKMCAMECAFFLVTLAIVNSYGIKKDGVECRP